MSTYTQIIYQIVFSTKNREHTLTDEKRNELFRYISGIIKNQNVIYIKLAE
jgi:putative transposase